MTDLARGNAPARTVRFDPRLWAGIGSVVVFLVGLAATNALAPPGAPASAVGEQLPGFAASAASASVNALGQGLSAVALVVFTAGLSRVFAGRAGNQIVAFGTLAAATLLLSSACMSAIATLPPVAHTSGARTVFALAFAVGGAAHVGMLGALLGTSAIAGRRSGVLPNWLSTFGMVVAALGLLALLNLAGPLLPPVTALFIPAGRFLGFTYLCVLVVVLRRASARRTAR